MTAFYRYEALETWPREHVEGKQSQFRSKWGATMNLLLDELRQFPEDVRWDSIVLKTCHSSFDVRKDGMLRADVRAPDYPGVILEFEIAEISNGKTVTRKVQFPCDTYNQWKDNVRAIAMGMGALRAVARYGITSSKGEQYEGFKAKTLPPAIILGQSMSFADACSFLIHKAGVQPVAGVPNKITPASADSLYYQASHLVHPDKGGDHDTMAKLNLAREVIRNHFAPK